MAEMTERWIVDAMNVIGSRPDGWWKDTGGGGDGYLVEQIPRGARSPARRIASDSASRVTIRGMRALLIGGQIVALLAMVAVSLWGRKNLHDEARIRARVGLTGLDFTMDKNTSLLYAPALGSVVVIGTLAVMSSANAETIAALGLVILVMLLLAHWSAVRRAAR